MKKKNKNNLPSPIPSPRRGEGGRRRAIAALATARVRGKRILITRAREQSGDFATQLRKLGAEVIELPTIEIVPPISWERLDQAINQLKSYDWIIFTSANGVNFFWQRLQEKGKNRLPSSLKICAIGPATANQFRRKEKFRSTISRKNISPRLSSKDLKRWMSRENESFWHGLKRREIYCQKA